MEARTFHARTAAVTAATLGLLAALVCLLYYYQIKVGVDETTLAAVSTYTTRETTSAARGSITDREGTVLVSDRVRYRLALDVTAAGDYAAQGQLVKALLALCEQTGDTVTDSDLPITRTAPYAFTNEAVYSYYDSATGAPTLTRLGKLCRAMGWEETDSADAFVAELAGFFGLSTEDRAALGVLYSCYLREKEILWTDYAVVEDASIALITKVEEGELAGVTVTAATARQYSTAYAAHLLGQVGAITAENWAEGENYQAQGYDMNDIVGLSGVEYAFEGALQGTDGLIYTTVDRDGDVIGTQTVVQAQKGADVALTLDMRLQAAAEQALADHVPALNDGEGGAAAVVIDVSDGSILTCASYPTFDPATLEYEAAFADLSPLFNRCLQGTYSPGSTYKMVTATAALETGIITPDTTIPCTGYLDYYDTRFRCWIYRESGATHSQRETVTDALRDSCNIFFYNLSIEVGIDTLTEYAQSYGLGVATGVELREALGVNAGPAYSQRVGATWYGGNVLSAAIGQSDNLFTPLQIANYIAALVNGGTRWEAHLLEKLTYADGTVEEYRPQVLGTVALDEANLTAIKAGMRAVAQSSSTVANAFARLEENGIAVGAKTGSAQVTGQANANGLFVCFAPYDDPQVAVCVAVEKGGSGAATAVIAAEILESYFGLSEEG